MFCSSSERAGLAFCIQEISSCCKESYSVTESFPSGSCITNMKIIINMNARNRKAKRVLYAATFLKQITKYFNFALMKAFSFQVVLYLNNQDQCSFHHQIMRTNVVNTVHLTSFLLESWQPWTGVNFQYIFVSFNYDATKYRRSGTWISPHRFSSPVWETTGERIWLTSILGLFKCKLFPTKKEKSTKIEVSYHI